MRIPTLPHSNIVIRLAETHEEIEAANRLVYRNYINLYWPEDEAAFRRNKYVHSSARRACVAIEAGRVIGTMSLIKDSPGLGVPSDTFYPDMVRGYRQSGEQLAEFSCLAIDREAKRTQHLVAFLFKFLLQYSFYCAEIDRVILSCRPNHADFYERNLGFQKLTDPAPYPYAGNVRCQLLTLDLLLAYLTSQRQSGVSLPIADIYGFLLVDEHPNLRLPLPLPQKQPSKVNAPSLAPTNESAWAVASTA